MATASEITEKSETLKCPVCVTKFNNPRILPCLHTICEKCLRGNIESQGQDSAQISCPICKTPTVLPSDTGLNADERINELISDRTVKSLVDMPKSPDNKSDRCDECDREGENTIAKVWCFDCEEKLCDPCAKYHKRNKLTRQHTTASVQDVSLQKRRPAGTSFERSCARHPGKPLELFCVDHRELCCVLCFASNHRECNNIRGIDDVVKEQAKGFAYNKVLEDLLKMKMEVNKVIADKNDNVVQLEQEKEKLIDDMDVIVDRIITKLNELRKSFREKAGSLHEQGNCSLLKYNKVIQGFLTNIINSCLILEEVKELGSPRQTFLTFETIRCQIMSHHQQLQNDLKDDVKVHLTLTPNKVLQDMEKSLDSLGVVEITLKTNKVMGDSLNNIADDIKKLNLRTQLSTPMCAAQVEKSDMMTSSVTLVKTMTRQNLGKGTHITGGAFLRDGRLVMADDKNSRLLQLDDDYNIVREHKMDGNPIDVAAGNNQNEIYISLNIHPNYYICRCTLDTGLTITQKIKAPQMTCGIAVSGDTIIAAAPTAVSLLSQDGSTVKSIPRSGGLYSYVAVSHTPPSFYHEDGHSVVSRTFDGKELFRYNNDKLKTVRGICVHNNNVYVCGRDSHNVHVISCDGQRSRILLDKLHSISHACAVLFNQERNELIVTSWGKDTVFEVYKLS